jgi:GINS complex subunit 3
MKFLDIDEILAEEERIACIFSLDASGLGTLDPTSNEEDLPASSKVELPLWLAVSILCSQCDVAQSVTFTIFITI